MKLAVLGWDTNTVGATLQPLVLKNGVNNPGIE
jgi:hypothetical protein